MTNLMITEVTLCGSHARISIPDRVTTPSLLFKVSSSFLRSLKGSQTHGMPVHIVGHLSLSYYSYIIWRRLASILLFKIFFATCIKAHSGCPSLHGDVQDTSAVELILWQSFEFSSLNIF